MLDRHLGSGFFPAVSWDDGWVWCAWQDGGTLVAAKFDAALQPISELRWPLRPDALAFPALTRTAAGEVLLVYRDGDPDYAIVLRSLTRGLVETLATNGGGNAPCAISTDYVAWQDVAFDVWRRGLLGGVALRMRPGAPTGISRLRDDGWPILWDEDYTSVPGMTAPAFAGPVTVGEHPAGGVIGSWAGLSGTLHLWPGADTKAPSAAYSASLNRCLVAAWGATGIRLGIVTPDDLLVVAPMPGPKPPPTPGPSPPAPPPRPITPRPPAQPAPPERTPVPTPCIVTFRSVHGRYLCAEEGGGAIVTGDREQADVWERFTLTPIGEYVTLQSADGHYVCAEDGGGRELTATRDSADAWETFRLIPVDGGHAIQVANGQYVCAEPDGRVVADRTEIGAYETWTVDGLPAPEPPAPPGPGPGPLPAPPPSFGRVRLRGRVLHDDDGPFLGVGATLMSAARLERTDPAFLDNELAILAAGGLRFGRMMGCVGVPSYWGGIEIDPRWPDYRDVMIATLDRAQRHGLRMEVTLIGDGQIMVPSSQDKRDLVDKWIDIIAARPKAVVLAEVANEGWQNGFSGSSGEMELRNLGRRLRDGLRARGIDVPVTLSAPQMPDPASLQSLYGGGNADVVSAHYDRSLHMADGPWRPVRQPWDTQFVSGIPGAWSNNEPIGWTSNASDNPTGLPEDDDPTRLVAAMVVSFIAGHAYHVLHSNAGVRSRRSWGTLPNAVHVWQGINTIRRLLPPDLAGWEPQNDHWSGHPYQTVEKWVDGASSGVVRAYAATSGQSFVCLPMGIRREVRLEARRAQTVNAHDLLTGELIGTWDRNAGDTYRLDDSRSAYLLLGRFV